MLKLGKMGVFFFYKDLWEAFFSAHVDKTPKDEETVDELREKYPDEDLSKLLKRRDNEWVERSKGQIKGNLQRYTRKLEDKRASNKPADLLDRALSSLQAVDCEQQSFLTDPNVRDLVKKINAIIWDMKKCLDRG